MFSPESCGSFCQSENKVPLTWVEAELIEKNIKDNELSQVLQNSLRDKGSKRAIQKRLEKGLDPLQELDGEKVLRGLNDLGETKLRKILGEQGFRELKIIRRGFGRILKEQQGRALSRRLGKLLLQVAGFGALGFGIGFVVRD